MVSLAAGAPLPKVQSIGASEASASNGTIDIPLHFGAVTPSKRIQSYPTSRSLTIDRGLCIVGITAALKLIPMVSHICGRASPLSASHALLRRCDQRASGDVFPADHLVRLGHRLGLSACRPGGSRRQFPHDKAVLL